MSNMQLKVYLADSFENIDMTKVDESVLSTLSTQRGAAVTAATTLERKVAKRKADDMLQTYRYGFAKSSFEETRARKEAEFLEDEKKWEAIHFPAGSEQHKLKLEREQEKRESTARFNANYTKKVKSMEVKDLKLLEFFYDHCAKIDTKSAEIASTIPAYSPIMQAIVVTKKPPPATTAAVQTALGFAFREPDCVDQVALLAKLNEQLMDTDKAAKKANKTIDTRDAKLQMRPVSKYEKRHNNGIRKLWECEARRDNTDRYFAHWFEQHSLSIKAKIASIGCGA
jgi:hypothetical protein